MRLRMVRAAIAVVGVVLAVSPGCDCGGGAIGHGRPPPGGDGGTQADGAAPSGSLTVTPTPVTIDLDQGGPAATQAFTAMLGTTDVSAMATWTLDDPGLGTIVGGMFTSNLTHGGSTMVHARYATPTGGAMEAVAMLTVRFHAAVTTMDCPGCMAIPADAPACTTPGAAPTLVYPPDKVLLPPNMNVMEVQFMPGTGNSAYEVDFKSATLDVEVTTACNPITNTRGMATGGCGYQVDPTVWGYIAGTARGGDSVMVSVRAAPGGSPPTCASVSATRNISFAQEDLNGGIYYWQSVAEGGVAGRTGGIFRHDFGDPTSTSEPFLTPAGDGKCYGCHFLSRDGTRMTVGNDDADSDDEYNDLHGALIDVATISQIGSTLPAGFQTFSPDHTRVLASDGPGSSSTGLFHQYDGDSGSMLSDATFSSFSGMRITHPDWSKDGATVYFVVTSEVNGTPHPDDDHFAAGSIYKVSYDAATDTFGTPAPVVMSSGANENNYYPSISPDGQFLIFDRATGTDTAGRDSYNNPTARLWAMHLPDGAPIDMMRANQGDGLTDSWPRWSPFIQMYQGKQLLWVTFSSTRDYGLHVQNTGLVNCYPPDSPENPGGRHGDPLPANCNQPQIWMAAISLSDLEFGVGDPSYPAFWMPFQDVTAHNHIAQWVEHVVHMDEPDGSVCGYSGDPCGSGMPCCTGLTCNSASLCAPGLM